MLPTCQVRSKKAKKVIKAYAEESHKGEDISTIVTDLLADLQHFCRDYHVDFQACSKVAQSHFDEEYWFGGAETQLHAQVKKCGFSLLEDLVEIRIFQPSESDQNRFSITLVFESLQPRTFYTALSESRSRLVVMLEYGSSSTDRLKLGRSEHKYASEHLLVLTEYDPIKNCFTREDDWDKRSGDKMFCGSDAGQFQSSLDQIGLVMQRLTPVLIEGDTKSGDYFARYVKTVKE